MMLTFRKVYSLSLVYLVSFTYTFSLAIGCIFKFAAESYNAGIMTTNPLNVVIVTELAQNVM